MRPTRLWRDQGGSAAVEAVVLVPVIMVFVLLAVALGRFETARTELIGLARQGAEAASVMPNSVQASRAATLVGSSATSGAEDVCQKVNVSMNTDRFVPDGSVDVTLRCRVHLADLGAPGLNGIHDIIVDQVAPIDPYRAVTP